MEMNEDLEAVAKKCVKHAEVAYPVWTTGTTIQEACMLMDASPGKMLQLLQKAGHP